MKRLAHVALVVGVFWLLLISCRREVANRSAEVDELKDVVTAFMREAFGKNGNIDAAYALLSTEARQFCSRSAFTRQARTGQQFVGDRELRIADFNDIRLSGDSAKLTFDIRIGRQDAFLLPHDATLAKENGEWRYVITSDPTCEDLLKFFNLTPGPTLTPVSELDARCDPAYPFDCIPRYPPDLECSDIDLRNFPVVPPDPHGFDPDGDGFGCEE